MRGSKVGRRDPSYSTRSTWTPTVKVSQDRTTFTASGLRVTAPGMTKTYFSINHEISVCVLSNTLKQKLHHPEPRFQKSIVRPSFRFPGNWKYLHLLGLSKWGAIIHSALNSLKSVSSFGVVILSTTFHVYFCEHMLVVHNECVPCGESARADNTSQCFSETFFCPGLPLAATWIFTFSELKSKSII